VTNNVLDVTNYSQYKAVFANGTETNFTYDYQGPVEKLTNALALAKEVLDGNIILKMRTFEAAMYCVAKQEVCFKKLETNNYLSNITFKNDGYGPYAIVTRADTDHSTFKVRPTMKLTYGDNELSPHAKLVEVNYDNVLYSVGDAEGTIQNRTVFTMLSYLFSQTAISTQNLPVQQLIRVQ
jgi:hypothetical protein